MEEWESKLRKARGSLILTVRNSSSKTLKLTSEKFENIKCVKKHTVNEILPQSTQKIGVKLLEKHKSREGTINLSWQVHSTADAGSSDKNTIVTVHIYARITNVEAGPRAEVTAEIFPPHGLTYLIQPEPDTTCLLYTVTLSDEHPSATSVSAAAVATTVQSHAGSASPSLSAARSAVATSRSHSQKTPRHDKSSQVTPSPVVTPSSSTSAVATTSLSSEQQPNETRTDKSDDDSFSDELPAIKKINIVIKERVNDENVKDTESTSVQALHSVASELSQSLTSLQSGTNAATSTRDRRKTALPPSLTTEKSSSASVVASSSSRTFDVVDSMTDAFAELRRTTPAAVAPDSLSAVSTVSSAPDALRSSSPSLPRPLSRRSQSPSQSPSPSAADSAQGPANKESNVSLPSQSETATKRTSREHSKHQKSKPDKKDKTKTNKPKESKEKKETKSLKETLKQQKRSKKEPKDNETPKVEQNTKKLSTDTTTTTPPPHSKNADEKDTKASQSGATPEMTKETVGVSKATESVESRATGTAMTVEEKDVLEESKRMFEWEQQQRSTETRDLELAIKLSLMEAKSPNPSFTTTTPATADNDSRGTNNNATSNTVTSVNQPMASPSSRRLPEDRNPMRGGFTLSSESKSEVATEKSHSVPVQSECSTLSAATATSSPTTMSSSLLSSSLSLTAATSSSSTASSLPILVSTMSSPLVQTSGLPPLPPPPSPHSASVSTSDSVAAPTSTSNPTASTLVSSSTSVSATALLSTSVSVSAFTAGPPAATSSMPPLRLQSAETTTTNATQSPLPFRPPPPTSPRTQSSTSSSLSVIPPAPSSTTSNDSEVLVRKQRASACMQSCYSMLESGCFDEAFRHAQNAIRTLLGVGELSQPIGTPIVSDPSAVLLVAEIRFCAQYAQATHLLREIRNLEEQDRLKQRALVTRYLAEIPLLPKHRVVCLRMAANRNFDLHNYYTAAHFLQLLLAMNLPDKDQLTAKYEICKQHDFTEQFSPVYNCPKCGTNVTNGKTACVCGRKLRLCFESVRLIKEAQYGWCTRCDANFSLNVRPGHAPCFFCFHRLLLKDD